MNFLLQLPSRWFRSDVRWATRTAPAAFDAESPRAWLATDDAVAERNHGLALALVLTLAAAIVGALISILTIG